MVSEGDVSVAQVGTTFWSNFEPIYVSSQLTGREGLERVVEESGRERREYVDLRDFEV